MKLPISVASKLCWWSCLKTFIFRTIKETGIQPDSHEILLLRELLAGPIHYDQLKILGIENWRPVLNLLEQVPSGQRTNWGQGRGERTWWREDHFDSDHYYICNTSNQLNRESSPSPWSCWQLYFCYLPPPCSQRWSGWTEGKVLVVLCI